jgi:hypothetical protein
MKFSEAEQAFHEDIREKKKAASGVHHKTGKRGYVGTMRFPTDIMSRKDKYNYRKAGKVMISNIYEEILTVEEFEKLELHEQKNRLAYWRTQYSNKEITQKMGIWNNKYYQLVAELQLPKATRATNKEQKPKRKAAIKNAPVATQEAIAVASVETPAPVQEIMVSGLHLVYNGTYTSEQIIKQLSKFELLLDNEPDEFYIELKLVQKQKK